MATRFWVGGTGNWDASTTTNWSATSGGGGGASVPTAADSVTFNSASNATAYTVTVTATASCLSLSIAGPASGNVTFAGSSGINVSGNATIAATGVTYTHSGNLVFAATGTLTTNGVTLTSSLLVGIGTVAAFTVTLGSALTTTKQISISSAATFTTSNFAITGLSINISTTPSSIINLGSSTVTLSAATPFVGTPSLTFNAGTSQINISNVAPIISFGTKTFYKLSLTSTAITTATFSTANSYTNLTIAGRAASGMSNVNLSADLTVTGPFTISAGTSAICRTLLQTDTVGTSRTITAAAVSITDTDFLGITGAGAASPFTGTRISNCANNSGITFTTGVNKYWNLATGGNYSDTGWALTSGGTPAINNFPLAQDTAIFQATGLNSGATITVDQPWNLGLIDMSARTSNTMTFATGSLDVVLCRGFINGTGTTLTGTGYLYLRGTGSITSAGISFTQKINPLTFGGTYTLNDSFTASNTGYTVNLDVGTIDLNGFTWTSIGLIVGSFFSLSKNITFNGGSIVLTGTSGFNNQTTSTYFSTTAGTGTGSISLTSASSKSFIGGGVTYNCTLNQGGAGALTITGSNTFSNITNTVQPASVLFTAGTTSTFTNFSLAGTAGNLITIGSVTAASHTLSKASGIVTGNYLSISRSTATGGATWNATNSTDGGNNSGWIFTSGNTSSFFFMFS